MKQHGLSLLEAVLALALIAITMATIIPVFANYAQQNSRNELRTTAVLVAQEKMDEIRRILPDDYGSVSPLDSSSPVEIDVYQNGKLYKVFITYAACSTQFTCTTAGAKYVNLQVYNDSNLYYEVENVFTRLE